MTWIGANTAPIEAVNTGKQKLEMFASKRGSEVGGARVMGRIFTLCRVPARLESQAPVSMGGNAVGRFCAKKQPGYRSRLLRALLC
jgi:hypothetical protein